MSKIYCKNCKWWDEDYVFGDYVFKQKMCCYKRIEKELDNTTEIKTN